MTGYQTPPASQGQIVVVSYACAGSSILRRTHDRSDMTTSYAVAQIGEDDWSWYDEWTADAGDPPLTEWRPIDRDAAAALLARASE